MKILFKNCTLLNGHLDMFPQPGTYVWVTDGVISGVSTTMPNMKFNRVIDLKGKYLMPGLINLHVHLPASGKPGKKISNPRKLVKFILSSPLTRKIGMKICRKNARIELASGVTTIRTVGGIGNLDTTLRNRINEGKEYGPRILAADSAIAPPDGHMEGSVAVAVTSVEECIAAVQKRAEAKVDLIKLMVTGGVLDAEIMGEPGILKMPADFIRACCDEAHRLGLKVAAHVESPEGVRVALDNGVDSIEHGAALDERMIELFNQNKAVYISTLSPAHPMAVLDRKVTGCDEVAQYNSEVVFNGIVQGTRDALNHNIPVGLGTDTGCPFVTHYDMWRELAYFVKYVGVTPAFALHTATLGNAKIAGIADVTGSVEVGKCADLLITTENPLEDFGTMRKPFMVCRGKKLIRHPKLKKYADCEEELDSHMP